eukprot:SAG22_NODE_16521_length_323_cov_1.142857_1_plen_88_part_10
MLRRAADRRRAASLRDAWSAWQLVVSAVTDGLENNRTRAAKRKRRALFVAWLEVVEYNRQQRSLCGGFVHVVQRENVRRSFESWKGHL